MARGIGRPMAVLVLSDEERSYLERQARRRRVARSLSDRCRMILRCADGLTNKAVAAELGVHEHTVGKWRRRFLKERIDGLSDEPRPGRPRTLTDEKVAMVPPLTVTRRSRAGLLQFPVRVEPGDRPDLVLSGPAGLIGIELTEAISTDQAKVDAMVSDFRPIPHYRISDPARSQSEIRTLARGQSQILPRMGDSVERDWVEAMLHIVARKAAPDRFVDTRVMARIAVRVALPRRVLSRVAGRRQVYLDQGAE